MEWAIERIAEATFDGIYLAILGWLLVWLKSWLETMFPAALPVPRPT